PTRSGAPPRA
ncbi:hypothetical protein CFC21_075791, partial [Triticum aestivum]